MNDTSLSWQLNIRSSLFVATGYLLLWVAILNGYPVFYPDSGGYLKVSFDLQQPIFRTIGYSIFIRLVNFESSPWLIIIAQCVITIFILHSVFKFMVRGRVPADREPLIFLLLIFFLSIGTTLPWFVGQVMPDVFAGLTLLSFFLLVYDSEMPAGRTVLVCLVFFVALAAHITHLLAAATLLLAVIVFRMFGACRPFWPARSIKQVLALVLIPILTVAALTALSNRRAGYGLTLSSGKPIFLFGRLVESGLAGAYLAERCKIEQLTPCKYLPNLPKTTDEALWAPNSLLKQMGDWNGAGEASKIVEGTIRYDRLGFAEECVKQMFRQFVAFSPGSGNSSITSGPEFSAFREVYPGELPRYLLSRQSAGKLQRDAGRVTGIYAIVFWCSLAVSVLAFISRRSWLNGPSQLFLVTLIFLFANAFETGALSGVHHRYQARVSWLMVLCCLAYVIPITVRWRRSRNVPDVEGVLVALSSL